MIATTSLRLKWVPTGTDRAGFAAAHPSHGEIARVMFEPTDTAKQKWSWVVNIDDFFVRGVSASAKSSALAAEAAISDECPWVLDGLDRLRKTVL